MRDLVLFDLAVDSKLRGCGLIRLRIDDAVPRGEALRRAMVVQSKTKTPVQFELTEPIRESLMPRPGAVAAVVAGAGGGVVGEAGAGAAASVAAGLGTVFAPNV